MPLFAAVFLSLFIHFADDLTLSVNVVDANGGAIPEATVLLENTTDQKFLQSSTSEAGTCRFDRLPIGSYVLRVVKEGYYVNEVEIRLEASKVVDFTLVPVESRHDEIDVIARPEPINVDAVSDQQTVNDEVIQNLPYTGRRNFLNALALMPGVVRDDDGGLHIHGSRSDQIRYQLDGLNVTDPAGGLGSNIPIDAIESVDLDLTGYSAEFGKGSGGVVRVESKFVGDKFKWDLTDFLPGVNFRRKTVADFSPRFLLSGPIVRSKAWFMYSGSLRYVRTFNEELPEGMNRQNQTNADQLVKLQWNLRESHVLTLSLLNNSSYFGNAGLSPLRPLEATTNYLARGTTAAISDRNILGGAIFETTVQWTHARDSDLAKGTQMLVAKPNGWSGNFYSDRRGRTDRFHVAQAVTKEKTWKGIVHQFKVGGEGDYVISDLTMARRPFEIRDAADQLQLLVRFDGPDSAEIRNTELGFFIQDRMRLSPRLQVELGVRADRERVVGTTNMAPRLAASYLPFGNDRSKLSGGIGVFYDNVTLNNFQFAQMQRRLTTVYDDGIPQPVPAPTAIRVAPDLQSPYGIHWNAGWDQEWAPRWVSRINFIQKRDKHQTRLGAIPAADGFDLQFNSSGKATYNAVEVSLDRPIRTNLRFLGSYIYSQARARPTLSIDFPDPAIELIGLTPVDWNAAHRLVAWAYFPFILKTSGSFAIDARSGFPFTPVDEVGHVAGPYNELTMPAFFSTNVSVEKEIPIVFGKRMAVRLSVTNLFNRFNPRYIDANVNSPTYLRLSDSSGRSFTGRVRLLKK
jgi:outer membrane receptor for ferrienterochelin and colicin